MMMLRTRHAGKTHGTGTGFPRAEPTSERNIESYYVCGIMRARHHGSTLYAAMPLNGTEARELEELDGKQKKTPDVGISLQRRKILDAHSRETKLFLAKTGAYGIGSFVPRTTAETLIARTSKIGARL